MVVKIIKRVFNLLFLIGMIVFFSGCTVSQYPSTTMFSIQWYPEEPDVGSEYGFLTQDQIKFLREAGAVGQIISENKSTRGEISEAPNVFLVMKSPIAAREYLPVPSSQDIVIIQTDDGWEIFPEGVSYRPQRFILEPSIFDGNDVVRVSLEREKDADVGDKIGGFTFESSD